MTFIDVKSACGEFRALLSEKTGRDLIAAVFGR